MAVTNVASTLVVTSTGDQTLTGPVDIVGIVVPAAGTAVLKKGATTILSLAAGTYQVQLRSTSDLIINGACTILLRTDTHC